MDQTVKMGNQLPRISVVMSVYNGEEYLREAVDSILNQTLTEFEFIVANDASTDGTAQILADSARREPRIRLLSNPKKLGLARSLNRGLEQARGQYIVRMDTDDISLPVRLEKQLVFMEKHPEIGVLGTAVELIDSDGKITGQRIYPPEPIVIRWRLVFENPICHPTTIIRRDLLQCVQYNPDLTTAQDYDLWCRLGSQIRFANLPEPLLHFRKHGANLTYQKGEQQRANSLQISQDYLTELMKISVPDEVVRYLWDRQRLFPKQSLEIVKLMDKIASVILAESGWSDIEKKTLRRHVASWILNRSRNDFKDPLTWSMMWKAAKLEPLFMFQRLLGWLLPIQTE